jgi:hypothetical protein
MNQNLLRVWAGSFRVSQSQTVKSFLLLFFKKEVLASLKPQSAMRLSRQRLGR